MTRNRPDGSEGLIVCICAPLVVEEYTAGSEAEKRHTLACRTMPFTGVMALAAAENALLVFDEPVAGSAPWWRGDPQK